MTIQKTFVEPHTFLSRNTAGELDTREPEALCVAVVVPSAFIRPAHRTSNRFHVLQCEMIRIANRDDPVGLRA